MAAAAEDVARPTSSKGASGVNDAAEETKNKPTESTPAKPKDTAEAEKAEAEGTEKKKVLVLPPRALNPMEVEKLIYSLMEIPPSDFEKRLPNV